MPYINYHFLMIISATLVLYFNYYAQAMSGLLPSYQAFANVIRAGFDTSITDYYPLTFPLWGYGFLMAISNNYLFLKIVQLTLALSSVWYAIAVIEKNKLLKPAFISLLKALLVICIPWYAFHTVLWPYSIASSLLIFSITMLYQASQQSSYFYWIISGLLFGILLNFRSDYILMPLGLSAIMLWHSWSYTTIKKVILWISCIYLCLIPWALFTHKVCGHYLITSTNGGHHLLSGLGGNPHNKWGIAHINSDNCPVIHHFVKQIYGENAITWDYKGDKLLKKTFFNLIKKDPYEYIKKCFFNFKSLLKDGVYNGEFFMKNSMERDDNFDKNSLFFIKNGLHNPTLIKTFIAIKLQNISYWIASAVTSFSILSIFLCLFIAFITNNLFSLLINSIIIYQISMNTLCHHYSGYTSNVFLFFILNILYLFQTTFSLSKKRVIL